MATVNIFGTTTLSKGKTLSAKTSLMLAQIANETINKKGPHSLYQSKKFHFKGKSTKSKGRLLILTIPSIYRPPSMYKELHLYYHMFSFLQQLFKAGECYDSPIAWRGLRWRDTGLPKATW